MSTSAASPTLTARTQYVRASNGVRFAYRTIGEDVGSDPPLVMHMHFRGNLDFWDPALVDPLAGQRRVIIFDQAGVGRSSGAVAETVQGWADNVIALVDALGLAKIDLLGFSMGGMAVQMVVLTRPDLVRKLILAGTRSSQPGPAETGAGLVWPRDEANLPAYEALRDADPEDAGEVEKGLAVSFFYHNEEGREACRRYRKRVAARNVPDEPTDLNFLGTEGTKSQSLASKDWNTHNVRNSFDRLGEIKIPTLVVNGDDDLLIPTSRSWELAKMIEGAGLIIYPRAGHGFLWQYAPQFARDINGFLGKTWPEVPSEL